MQLSIKWMCHNIMKRFTSIPGAVLIFLLLSCNIDSVEPNIDDEALVNGLINFNSDLVALEINKLTVDLKPKFDGHESNLNILIQRIELQTSLTVVNFCYACIYTLPPLSEIELEVDSLGILVSRIIDIQTPEKDALRFKGFHN